ncbi:RagB/SusD family nutrient uptake outer membrane protein [Tenacibaculum piscium]|uniref:RagB/SusD family nutrient uptake outer membrane protein n=1 Tax=Tenacibaculum piscium TaxID=1458515 RepID=UPI001EFAFCEA|nr:RagB/SusD family nutrient uptake outer membrane protein [Tenacibaculum piscium]MCG8183361.1 RagB/SusD family nutrient uptake outer membrane protein [Tenacibaculum piscium]MCG8204455.1 RagB/SusD family nutrient uptake outer membrane protein [Tenacibaculum piscium]
MKKIKYIKIAILLVGIFVQQGCSDEILTQDPDHVISEVLVIKSVDKLQSLLNGSYNEISKASYLGRNLYKRAAVKGTDFRFVKTTYNPRDYEQTEYKYNESSNNNGGAESLWLQSYKAIGNLNLILDNIENAEGSNIDKKQIKAEALALRGMIYFDLTRTFTYPWIKEGEKSQGLPLKLSSSEIVIERSNLGATYNQIILDLKQGLQLIKNDSWAEGSTKYITKTGINALLARVYLYKQDWNNALFYAKKVIAVRGESYLMGTDNYQFNDYTSESLFEISIDNQNSVGSNGLGAQFDFREGGQGDVIATQTFVNLLKSYKGDPRKNLLTDDKEGTKMGFVKYINREGGSGLSIHNVPVIRLSEVYLIAAEACANGASGLSEAKMYLNTLIRKRTTDFDAHKVTASGNALKKRIHEERRKELALEGHGVYDYIRTGTNINRLITDHINTGLKSNNLNIVAFSPQTIYPIPASEVKASGMKQTKGY